MTVAYDLFIADKTFSSWSLRGWLMFEKFGIPYRENMIGLYAGTMQQDMATLAPARLVPVIRTEDGMVVGDTLAIAETLAERHPDAGLWPSGAAARAFARWVVAEMHSGFTALRSECPMQLECRYLDFAVSEAVKADLARIETLWEIARKRHGSGGPWLFGTYSLADVFYAPVAARITGYGLSVGPDAMAYVAAHMTDEAFRKWRAAGLTVTHDPHPYPVDATSGDWPF